MNNKIWGGILNPGAQSSDDKVLCVQAAPAEFSRLLEYWAGMNEPERPELHGLSLAPRAGSGSALELLLGQGKGSPLVILQVTPTGLYSRPSQVWPYSMWWEEELRAFGGIEFAGTIPERDASWRPL